MKLLLFLLSTQASAAAVLIRLMTGAVFLSEGIQKFLYPGVRGAGRFADIGLSNPEFLGTFVGGFEVVCGILVLFGILTRLSVIPFIIIMIAAIYTTKIPIGFDQGFWQMAHAARTDFSMLLGSLYLLTVGGGPLAVDRFWYGKYNQRVKYRDYEIR